MPSKKNIEQPLYVGERKDFFHEFVEQRLGQCICLRREGLNRAAHVAQVVHAFASVTVCEILAAVFKTRDAVFVEKFLCVCIVELLVQRVANFVVDSHMSGSFQLRS